MQIYDIIDRKRHEKSLGRGELQFFIDGLMDGSIPDYQTSALLMAICIRGMSNEETYNLTDIMLHSGEILTLPYLNAPVVDKHSTGGVGDTVTLALAPALACCGAYVAKMSGRGLGFTGGTIDKLESIPGYRTDLSSAEFMRVVKNVGCSIIGQTDKIAAADKKLYALRDVTATIDSMPLIASSVVSKKLASGAEAVLLDVKYGAGAFMKTKKDALSLAKLMVATGVRGGKAFAALITSMQQPLAKKIGNSLEVIGAVEVLKGEQGRLYDETVLSGQKLLALAGICSEADAKMRIERAINSGAALAKLAEMVRAQGGDASYIECPEKFKLGRKIEVYAKTDGYVRKIQTENVGKAVCVMGGGRISKTDAIDNSVGVEMCVCLGDRIYQGDILGYLYHNEKGKDEAAALLAGSVITGEVMPEQENDVYAYVTAKSVEFY